MEKINLSIIIPSWNTKRLLRQCLKSLILNIQYSILNYEIIVVDNGSTDGSPQMVRKEFPRVCLIENKTNLGFGAANNQGMKIAKGRYFLLLNSDTIIQGKALTKMVDFFDDHPEAGIIGPKLLNTDGTPQPSVGPFPGLIVCTIMLFLEHWFGHLVRFSPRKIEEVDWVMGAAFMVRPEVIERAGWMDEGIFMYMDEVEWAYRIKKAGYKILFYPDASIVHLLRASSKSGRKGPILNIYRGLIYFYRKHYSPFSLLVLRIMLQLKAALALFLGRLTGNQYLTETYGEALVIARS